ncbi:PLxRFG domain-containing protein, partial [Rudaea sp.]|uniref:PLxRFG domain-containing protein n=1 Tax=Rudaea sp. TaxID=2136325 RepID=UPI00321FD940
MRALLRAAQRGLRRQGQGRAERDGGADGLRYRRTVFDATREAVVDAVRSPRTFNLLNRTVGTQFHKAWKSPQFRPVYDAVQDFLSDAQAFAYRASGKAPTLLPRLNGLRDVVQHLMPRTPDGRRVSRADTQAAATALFDGRIEDKLFSDADLRKRGLTDVQISLYREARAAVDASLDDVAAAVMGRIAGDHVGEQVLSRMKDDPAQAHAIVSRALAEIAAAEQKARDAALAEQKAAGDAAYEKAKGEALAAGKSAARAEVLAEKARDKAESAVDIPKLKATAAADLVKAEWDRIRSLKEKGYAPLMRFGDYFVRVTEKDARGREKVLARVHFETRREANIAERELRATYPDADVQLGVLAKEDSSMFDGLTPETLELFGDAIGLPAGPRSQAFQEYLQTAVANRSALKRMIHARKIAGYSADAERVLASFIISNGRYAARQYNLPRANEAWANIPEHMGDVRDEAAGLIQYVNNPRDEAAGVRSLLFAHFLGGSVASAITNMTQPVMMTLPYLSSIVGPVKAAQLLTRAVAITAGGVDRIADPGLRAAMQRAVADGVVAPQEIHQLYAEAIRNGLTDNRVVGRWLRSAATVWGAMFSVSEQINRRLTFAAGYMAAKGRGDSDAQAAAFAERAVQGTQGVYNKGNRPNWARGAVGATVFTFKQYSIAYMEFLSRLPRREKAMALGILALAAGIQGLPFAGDLDDGLDTLMQAFGYDWSTEEKKREFLRRWLSPGLADFAQYGLSTTGLPIDFQARLGLGNLVPGTELFKRSSTDRTRDVLEITGPAGSVVQQWMRAWDAFANTALAEGAVVSGGARALKEVLPVAVGNAMKAADMAGGYALDYRGRRVAPTTTGDAVSKAIGFQPASLAQQGRDARIAQERIALAKEERATVSDLFARSRVEKDPELAMRARQRMANWNRRNPESRITVDAAQIRQRVKAMLETRDERLIRSAPRTMRRDIAEQI